MELEKQVTSVELSNKLHKLGVTTPSLFFREWTGAKEEEIEMWRKPDYCLDNVNCYTVAELGEILKPYYANLIKLKGLLNFQPIVTIGGKWRVDLDDEGTLCIEETEADARAKILIYLLENKLIDPATLSK